MKNFRFIVLFGLLASFTSCTQSEEAKMIATDLNGWKTLSESNYSILYPENWELNNSKTMGTSFILLSPLTSKGDLFRENINFIVQDLSGYKMDLDAFTDLSEDQITTGTAEGKIISSERISSKPMTFQKLIYTAKQGIYDLKMEQYYWVENDQAYILTLTCEVDQFSDYQSTGERMLESFQFTLD